MTHALATRSELLRDLRKAEKRITELGQMLRRLEWSDFDYGAFHCPVCENEKERHGTGCELAALLEEATP